MPKQKNMRVDPVDHARREVRGPGRPSIPGMPKSEYPQMSLYLGWELWETVDFISKKWKIGPSVVLQRLLAPVIDACNEDRRKGEFTVKHTYSYRTDNWIGNRQEG